MALTYGEISAITEKYFLPKLIDQVFASNILFDRMRKGKMMSKIDGGTSIMQPVMYATTSAVGAFSGTDTLSTTSNDQITAAEWTLKQYYANITITRSDELKNNGDRAVVNFTKCKVQVAEKTLSDTLGTAIYNLGTTANELVGLRLAVDSAGTYGGISRTDYSWWAAQEDSTSTVLSIANMEAMFGDCTVGNDKPTLIITTQDGFDDFHALLSPQERYMDSDTANAGFTNLTFRGVPVVVDNKCPSSHMFFLNENYIKLLVHSKEDFRFEPFQKPIDQAVACAKIFWAGALTLSNPRMQGKMAAIA